MSGVEGSGVLLMQLGKRCLVSTLKSKWQPISLLWLCVCGVRKNTWAVQHTLGFSVIGEFRLWKNPLKIGPQNFGINFRYKIGFGVYALASCKAVLRDLCIGGPPKSHVGLTISDAELSIHHTTVIELWRRLRVIYIGLPIF